MYLNTHTCFSLKYGLLSTTELLELIQNKGFERIALTDINNTSACMDFIRLAHTYGISPVVGIDFRNGVKQLFVGIAKNNKGFYELNAYLSKYLHGKEEIPEDAPEFNDVFVIYPYKGNENRKLKESEYLGVSLSDINRFKRSDTGCNRNRLLAFVTATFRNKKDHNVHRLLRAMDKNILLSKLPKEEEAEAKHLFFSRDQIACYYQSVPFLLENTNELLAQCSVHFDFNPVTSFRNKRSYTSSEKEDLELLKSICRERLKYRYPRVSKEIEERLEMELDIISEKGFVSYFLINYDIVHYAIRMGYYYVGRGSGANSIVAYLLRITDVDPIELDLYFERFINLYRKNPPDFDIDFSWKERGDITRYIFERFPKAVLLATYNTFKYKGVVRELGKVFGLPKYEIDKLSEGKLEPEKFDSVIRLIQKYAVLIQGLPNHLSVHSSGIIIPEKSIHHYSATFLPPKGFPTTQFSMIEAEDLGFYKLDILGQRGLAKVKDALQLIAANHPHLPPVDIHAISAFKKDKKIKNILRKGEALGCFYVESPAMRMLLKKLKVSHYKGLVAASSIIRPGVAKSGMMREYILRFRNKERRQDAHKIMLEIMPETFGIMVYQEDVIKVAHIFAGLTLAEADHLRRGMSGKFRSREEFQEIKQTFFSNCRKKKYSEKLIAEIWMQIESFAGYAFSKGHSASYAVESYQCLYLKAHFPLEYLVATFNNFGGFYRTSVYIHEAKMLGAKIHFPCINKSSYHSVINGEDIYLGFNLAKSLEINSVGKIMQERESSGPFLSFYNFLERVNLPIEQLSLLIRMDAFRFTKKNKRELLWEAHLLNKKQENRESQGILFPTKSKEFKLPQLSQSELENEFDRLELFGFSAQGLFAILKNDKSSLLTSRDFESHYQKEITILGELVAVKKTITSTKQKMYFGTFLDIEGHFFDTTHFPDVAKKSPFRGKGVYAIKGVVVEEFDFFSIEVTSMYKEELIEDPRYKEENTQAIIGE